MSIRILLSRSLALVILGFAVSSCETRKTGYVDVFRLVAEFELQKEYSQQALKDAQREQAFIDSLVYVEKLRNPTASAAIKGQLYEEFIMKTNERNKEIEKLIWTRLNPYLAEYGKEHGYSYIYGANGTGNVLYASESEDITDELIQYVNNRYHDKK